MDINSYDYNFTGKIFTSIFLIMVALLIMNLFVAILTSAYAAITNDFESVYLN